jgi:hypothetical protein
VSAVSYQWRCGAPLRTVMSRSGRPGPAESLCLLRVSDGLADACGGSPYEARVTARITGTRCRMEVVLSSFMYVSVVCKLRAQLSASLGASAAGGAPQRVSDLSDNG